MQSKPRYYSSRNPGNVTIYTTRFNIYKLSILLTQCIYVFLMVLREKLIISLNRINLLVFVTEMKYVYFEVGAAFLNMICMNVGRRSG
jgi:hypothetical protein